MRRKRRQVVRRSISKPNYFRSDNRWWLRIKRLVLVLLSLTLLGLGISLISQIFQSKWQGSEPYRYVVVQNAGGKEAWIVDYYPQAGRSLVIRIPMNTVITVAHDYGSFKIGSLLELGRQEHLGDQLLRWSLMRSLGLMLRGVVQMPNMPVGDSPGLILGGVKQSAWRLMWKQISQRDGSWWDSGRVWWQLQQLTEAQLTVVDMSNKPVFDKQTDVDGSEMLSLNELQFDNFYESAQQNLFMAANPLTVAIENSTDRSGYADITKRILEHEGFDVVTVADQPAARQQTLITTDVNRQLDQTSNQELKFLFPEAGWQTGETQSFRSDVVIELGITGADWGE